MYSIVMMMALSGQAAEAPALFNRGGRSGGRASSCGCYGYSNCNTCYSGCGCYGHSNCYSGCGTCYSGCGHHCGGCYSGCGHHCGGCYSGCGHHCGGCYSGCAVVAPATATPPTAEPIKEGTKK